MATTGILLLLFLLYRITSPSGLTWQHGGADGAELTVASAVLGIAHPPGYMLYSLLGWSFQQVAFSTPFQQMLFMSQSLALLACVLITLWVKQPTYATLSAMISLGLSYTFWTQAVIVEVYLLLTVLFLANLVVVEHLHHTPRPRLALLAGHLVGLSLTHHLSSALWLPGLLLWMPPRRVWAWGVLGVITGLHPWLWMLMRASADPLLNWGDVAASGSHFWSHITGQIYQIYLQPLSIQTFWAGLAGWLSDLTQQFTWVGVVLALAGVAEALRTRQRRLLGATLFWVVVIAGFTGLYRAENTREVYVLPLNVLTVGYIALGTAALARQRLLQLGIPLLLTILLIHQNFSRVDLTHDHRADDFIQNVAVQVPTDAIVVVDEDEETFTLWYAQDVARQFQNNLIINRNLFDYDWYRSSIAQRLGVPIPADLSFDEWLRNPAFSQRTIASTDVIFPWSGRETRRIGEWYLLVPASG